MRYLCKLIVKITHIRSDCLQTVGNDEMRFFALRAQNDEGVARMTYKNDYAPLLSL